jgi:glycerol-3-phosphate dehydrogenase (NAD(P)+)
MASRPDLAVFGAGAWGTALAIAWARAGAEVALWSVLPAEIDQLRGTGRHLRFTDVELPPTLTPVKDAEAALGAPVWVSAMPVQVSAE